MSESHHKTLFLDAIELPVQDRRAFLERATNGDPGLRERVERLLEAHERAEAAGAAVRENPRPVVSDEGPSLPAALGNYELVEVLASGGSGVVYRARQLDLGRDVAVKLLRSGRFATEHEVLRFKAEAEAAGRLDHPAIVPIHEVGSHEGRHFISMKLVDGAGLDRSLDSFLEDQRAAASLIARVARAVDHAHRRGVLHRDIKPSNILLGADGSPYVADFGTAKLLNDDQRHTMTGWILGTPTSMAPEQVEPGREVTVATDVYGLGCVLYELLTGEPPFPSKDLVEVFRQIREDPPTGIRSLRPEVHRDLETICLTCLAKDPTRRYDSALALSEDLERWLASKPIRARPTSVWERALLVWRRKPAVMSLAAAVAVLLVALVVGAVAAGFELRSRIEETREAEASAREQTRKACLAEARALRRGGSAGRRDRALELLRQAHAIRPGPDVVSEAVANLALTDLVTELEWERPEGELWVAFDPALERYVSSHADGTVEMRRVADRELLYTLPGNGHPAWRPRFSPDGRYLALLHHPRGNRRDPLFCVWDLERREKVYTLEEVPTSTVDFSPNREVLALVTEAGWLFERDLESGGERRVAEFEEDDPPAMVAYDPAGEHIAVVGANRGTIRVFTIGGELLSFQEIDEPLYAVAWSPDGSRIAVGSHHLCGYVFDAATGARLTTLEGHRAEVVRVHFPTPDLVATYSWDGSTRVWEAHTGRELLTTEEMLVTVDRSGRRLCFLTDSTVAMKAFSGHEVLRTLHGHERKSPRCVAVSPGGRWAASGGHSTFIVWDLARGTRTDQRARKEVRALQFVEDGILYVGSDEGLERIRLEDGRCGDGSELILEGRCSSLASTEDGSVLAALSGGAVHLFHREQPERGRRIEVPPGTLRLSLSRDGQRIAAGSWRGSGVHVWSTAEGTLLAHLWPEEGNCTPRFSPDGELLLIGMERDYHLHEVRGFAELSRWPRRGQNNRGAHVTRFTPDGRRCAVLVGQSEVGLLDSDLTGELAVLVPPEPQTPIDACFTRDGRRLVLATDANHVLVWDLLRVEEELRALGMSLEPGGRQ